MQLHLVTLTALLNSKLSHYWFKYKGKLTGNLLQIDKNQLLTFPISNISRIEEELISSYINEIIAIKQNNVNAITGAHTAKTNGILSVLPNAAEKLLK